MQHHFWNEWVWRVRLGIKRVGRVWCVVQGCSSDRQGALEGVMSTAGAQDVGIQVIFASFV